MANAEKFIEDMSYQDSDIDVVSVTDCYTALKIKELEVLKAVENNTLDVIARINELSIYLKKIK
jgi:hypothetical protein